MNKNSKSTAPKETQEGIADLHTPLLYNFWYVAGYLEDFKRELQEKTFLNHSVVIYRTQNGDPVALQNRCAHRSFPLSESWLEGDDIRCRYHGAKSGPDGVMLEIPCQEKCPNTQAIRKYPVAERGPLVWIWMGNEDMADENDIPDTTWLNTDEGWEYATGSYHMEGNYLLMMENLMDLTHIPFLHQDSFNFPREFAMLDFEMEIDGDELEYTRKHNQYYHRNGLFPEDLATKFDHREYRGRSGGRFVKPGMMYGIAEIHLVAPEDGEMESYIARIPHFVTPETNSTTHYWFFHTRNFSQDNTAHTELLKNVLAQGFGEDKEAIDWLQKLQTRDHTPYQEINFKADKTSLAMRKIIKRLADQEHTLELTDS